ncbi:MAG: asparagine synthase (glutamine-hydrolyzing) [Chitinophagaceae bacterium]|nr:asparagine synthase (glutamine-hydrolyzing) [Chitinophagaceae bacterium]MBL0336065.1 asparagine synthase (glutamine-hydrolyzing) [Chitinophagaceae bacterium]
MCGIAGSINFELNKDQADRDLHHRGPDEQTLFREKNLCLHHSRLSIQDIGGGKQPMHYGPYTIIFNGEIYNHQELREKYKLSCVTHSDTETLLHLYQLKGAGMLNDLDGMFALVIYDRTKNELFLARDRAGKKPLYYFSHSNQLVFASELNALRNQLPLNLNEQNLRQFILMGYFYKTNTPYEHVYELQAGHWAAVSLDNPVVNPVSWWNIHDFYTQKSTDDFQTALEKTDHYLHMAVKRRLESSDLEVGSFLSGGIDSGLITSIAKGYSPSLKTFTVAFEGKYNEAPLAKLVADKYNTNHCEIKISYDHLVSDVETILSNYGEPFFDNSAIPSYYVSKAAKEYLTVILNGDGGDEIFSGYRRYVPFSKFDFFKSGAITRGTAGLLHAIMPQTHNKQNKYNYFYRLADLARKNNVHVYLSATMDSFEGFEKYLSFSSDFLKDIQVDFDVINKSGLTGLQKIMNLDFDNILAGNLLVKMDIATMAHSLEGRSPLLSKELLEYTPGLPDAYKIKGGQTKYLLRTLAKKYLPEQLINQPKRGFESPLKQWVDNELKPIIHDYILSPGAYCKNYVKEGFIEKLVNRQIRVGDEKRAKMIWTLFAFEVWYRKCYKK